MNQHFAIFIENIIHRLNQNDDLILEYIDDMFHKDQIIQVLSSLLTQKNFEFHIGSLEICNCSFEDSPLLLTKFDPNLRYYKDNCLIVEQTWMRIEWDGWGKGFKPKWSEDSSFLLNDLIREKKSRYEMTDWNRRISETVFKESQQFVDPYLQKTLTQLFEDEYVFYEKKILEDNLNLSQKINLKIRL